MMTSVSTKSSEQNPTTVEEVQAAYDKLTTREDDLNNRLDALLGRQCHLEAKLRSITKALPNLQIVHSDAQQLAEMIAFTAKLAENVSAKVRQLDLAKSRVSECQQRVHDLLDLQLCSEGVQTALRNEDYEKAAAHVHRFLSMDETLLKQTADDVAEGSSVDSSFSLLQSAASQLRGVVTHKFEDAVRAEDLASVERFFKIFPLLGMHDEGLGKFSLYLCTKLAETAQQNLKQALETNHTDKRANIIYADTLTLLFEGIARVIEIHQPLVETYYGPGRMITVVAYLQKECDRQSKRVLVEFSNNRQFDRKVQQVNELMRSVYKPIEKLDPKDLDLLLGELTIMHSRAELYIRFIRRRITNDLEVGIQDVETRKIRLSELEVLLSESELCHMMQELLGSYLLLEQYFMEESVKKAVDMDSLDEGSTTSSMVDDVFFIVRKCIRRACSSSSIDGVCAVINNACGLLESDYCAVLRQQLRQGYPSGYLDLTQAYNALQSSFQQGKLQTSDSEQTRLMFLAYLNNADVSTEYIDTLKRSLKDEIPRALSSMSEHEKGKVESCLSGFSTVTSSLKSVVDYGLQQLCSSAVKPRVNPWVDVFLSVSHDITEEDFSNYEANQPFVQSLIMNLNSLLMSFKDALSSSNYDALVTILTTEVTTQLEKVVLKTTFNRLGGLLFDKEVRALVSYLTNMTTWSIRDKFARLTQIATILNLEKVSEIMDYWGANSGPLTWRLTPTEVRQVMMLRVDFRNEDIKRLKL